MTTGTEPELISLGRIVRLQVQVDKIKSGEGINQRYTPEENLRSVIALRLDPGGVTGITESGETLPDVHHRDHPNSRFRGENGVSLLFTAHYGKMRERFGDHLIDGIAGESVLVDHDDTVSLEDLSSGIVVGEGEAAIEIKTWEVARPCAPFSKFALQFPEGQKPDRRVTEALQILDNGMRGFNGTYHEDQPSEVMIRLGDMVYRRTKPIPCRASSVLRCGVHVGYGRVSG